MAIEHFEWPDNVPAHGDHRQWGNGVFNVMSRKSSTPAVGDGTTDDRAAILAALIAAKAVAGTVWIPAGYTFGVANNFTIDNTFSGVRVTGGGTVKFLASLAGSSSPGWMFHIKDASTTIRNFQIDNLILDGNRAALGAFGDSCHGIVVGTDSLQEGCVIRDIRVHDFKTNGIQVFSGGVRVQNIHSYSNTSHGVGVSVLNLFGDEAELYNLTCYDNGGYGIDVSKGRVIGDNWVARGNTEGGIKYSDNCEYLQVGNVLTEDNTGPGFQQTGTAAAMELFIDNLVTRGNGNYGFRIASGKTVQVGKLVSIDNDGLTGGGANGSDVFISVPNVSIDSLYVEGATAHGFGLAGSVVKTYRIGYIEAVGCEKAGMYTSSGGPVYGVIGSGVFRNNNQAATAGAGGAALQTNHSGSIKANNCVFYDSQGSPTQTAGMYFTGGVLAEVNGAEFGTGIAAGSQVYSATAGTRVRFGRNNTGITTFARGSGTVSGTGAATARTFTLPTALSQLGGATYFAQITPASADAAGDHYVSAQTYADFTLTWAVAPANGTNNVGFRYDVELEIQR